MNADNSEEGWWQFLTLCLAQKDEKALDTLFQIFLTFEEQHDLAARYRIIKALLEGELSQRDMSSQLGVSIAQITRGSNALKLAGEGARRRLKEEMT